MKQTLLCNNNEVLNQLHKLVFRSLENGSVIRKDQGGDLEVDLRLNTRPLFGLRLALSSSPLDFTLGPKSYLCVPPLSSSCFCRYVPPDKMKLKFVIAMGRATFSPR